MMVDKNNQKKNTEVIFYNQTKGGVDTVDQMVGNYTCKCQMQRWSMVLWYDMIDIAPLKADTYILFVHSSSNM